MKVFIYSRAYFPQIGGIEQATFLLARGLARAGHEVTVATNVPAAPGENEREAFAVLRSLSIRAFAHEARRHDLVHSNGFSIWGTALALKARRPLIFTHAGFQAACLEGLGWHGGISCGFRLDRCVRLTARYSGPLRCVRQICRHPIGRWALRAAAANVAVSKAVARAIAAPRTTVVYNCADTDLFRPGDGKPNRTRFLFVGRFVAEKGLEVLIRALALEHSKGRKWGLDLVGAGPLEPAYRHHVDSLGLGDLVKFWGPLRGQPLAQAIRDSLAVVVPSACEEAFGLVAAEALSCGRVALVSDHGGLSEVVEGLGTAVAPGDVVAWANALRRTATDSAWRQVAETQAVEASRRFAPEQHVRSYLAVYHGVLDGTTTPEGKEPTS